MRKFLIVGCGGSGGATLAYMMDQLRSDLAEFNVDKIPAGWQFVHLDVPVSPTPVGTIGTVRDQGGTYVGTGPQTDSYKVLDNALAEQLSGNKGLAGVATWAPRDPESVSVPLSAGAGQYRAIGRMITLSQAAKVRDKLQQAWDTLFLVSTDSEMRAMSVPGTGKFDPLDPPIVLVVSSMAGGAGASMALDICRLLTMVSGLDPRLMGVFMVAPDIFESLPDSKITGVRANALAMLGEIVASQTGAAREHDVAVLRALGVEHGEGELIPFARVFPVGRYVGAQRTIFGDGSPDAVYRGLGRGLSALMMSGQATQQFVEWDLTNGAGVPGNRKILGWGNETWSNLPWGTFGFASLSMGRDRYKEYAAQRLARSSVDHLLTGHLQPGNPASDDEQVKAILDNQWGNICQHLGLPLPGMPPATWITGAVLTRPAADALAGGIVNSVVRPYMPPGAGVSAAHWSSSVQRVLAERREQLISAAQHHAEVEAFRWQNAIVERVEAATIAALGDKGLPYATGLVKRVRQVLQDAVVPAGPELLRSAPGVRLGEVPDEAKPVLAAMKGTVADTGEILERVLGGTTGRVQFQIYAVLADQISRAAAALRAEVLDPLIDALDMAQTLLRREVSEPARGVGLALIRTDEYAAWPSDNDTTVAGRFSEANNEVMLTSSAQFKAHYESDLPLAVGVQAGSYGLTEGVRRGVQYAVTGQWTTLSGTRAPADDQPVVERVAAWRSAAFPRHPETGEALIAQPARYDVHVRPKELRDRAWQFVGRPGESFDRFCSVSLREFVLGADNPPETELAGRHRDMAIKFGEAISLARPLASVNEKAMQALHDGAGTMTYQYKFSAIPFKDNRIADELSAALTQQPWVDRSSADAFTRALNEEAKIKRINIFGSYPNYSPLAYTAVIGEASKQWLSSSPGQRKQFWSMRRTRPLSASLPMHDNERRACVAGWVLGRAIGFIQVPGEPFSEPAYVWSTAERRWLPFPNPLLTPPSEFLAGYDWLPAVLESYLLAIAQSHQPPVMASMAPYSALRAIYDDSPEDPVSGMHTLAAKKNLTRFLRTGDTGTGVPSVIAGTDAKIEIDARAALVHKWFEEFGALAGQHYMSPGQGAAPGQPAAPGGGTFSVISVRVQASKTPMFHDLAPDVWWATQRLAAMVEECADAAKRPEVDTGMPQPPVGPGMSDFIVPEGGNF